MDAIWSFFQWCKRWNRPPPCLIGFPPPQSFGPSVYKLPAIIAIWISPISHLQQFRCQLYDPRPLRWVMALGELAANCWLMLDQKLRCATNLRPAGPAQFAYDANLYWNYYHSLWRRVNFAGSRVPWRGYQMVIGFFANWPRCRSNKKSFQWHIFTDFL